MTKNKNSVQGLICLERFTRFGVKTDKVEIVFFSVEPTNISVLSAANIDVKIHHLMMLLSTMNTIFTLRRITLQIFPVLPPGTPGFFRSDSSESALPPLQ